MTQLRLASINLWGNHAPWEERKRLLMRELRSLDADVIAMQEVLRPQGAGTSQADELARGLPYRVAFSCATRLQRPFPSEYGNALLTRFPVREHQTVPLPVPDGTEPRCLLYVVLSVHPGLLPVFVTHLSWEPELQPTRVAQTRFISDFIAQELRQLATRAPSHVQVLPPVLLGDLNASPDSPEVQQLLNQTELPRLRDSFALRGHGPGYTFSATNPYAIKNGKEINERIDYILVGSQIVEGQELAEVTGAKLVFNQPDNGIFASDHFGVCTEIKIKL